MLKPQIPNAAHRLQTVASTPSAYKARKQNANQNDAGGSIRVESIVMPMFACRRRERRPFEHSPPLASRPNSLLSESSYPPYQRHHPLGRDLQGYLRLRTSHCGEEPNASPHPRCGLHPLSPLMANLICGASNVRCSVPVILHIPLFDLLSATSPNRTNIHRVVCRVGL